jgi:hypothetical protein
MTTIRGQVLPLNRLLLAHALPSAALLLLAAGRDARADGNPGLKLTAPMTVTIDPICNAWSGVVVAGAIENTGADPVPIVLRLDPLVNEAGAAAPGARVAIAPPDDKTPIPPQLDPKGKAPFTVQIKGSLAPGKWSAALTNGGTPVGAIGAVVPEPPLHVKLAGVDANAPAITAVRGRATTLMVENTDPIGVDVDWAFRAGSTPLRPENQGQARIPPLGTAAVEIAPQEAWFEESGAGRLGGLFKEGGTDGVLTLRLRSEACRGEATPMKLLRLRVNLAEHPDRKKAVWSYALLFFVLFIGALCSVYLNFRLPDQEIRSGLKAQHKAIGIAIGGLSLKLASRLRVLVSVELRLLRERLRALRWTSAGWEDERALIATATEQLARRVVILERMSRLREDFVAITQRDVPPSILDLLDDLFERAVNLLDAIRPPDADVQAAELTLAQIKKVHDTWSQPDVTMAAPIVAALLQLSKDINDADGALKMSATWGALPASCATLKQQLATAPPDAAQILPTFTAFDRRAFRGKLLSRYALLCDARAPITGTPLEMRREDFLRDLFGDRWEAWSRADRLLDEMAEQIYGKDLAKEIKAGRVAVKIDRILTRVFDPAQFYLGFTDRRFDTARARDEWSCTWNFGHVAPGATKTKSNYLEEEGWSVMHFFPTEDSFDVSVTFSHETEGELRIDPQSPPAPASLPKIGKTVDLSQPNAGRAKRFGAWVGRLVAWSGENGSGAAKLGIALVPAIIALLAGAREQLLKMDLIPALGTVFLAGFGSDQVKNLLQRKKS